MTGYEDGTENPEGDEAIAAGVVTCIAPQLAGSSFVAVQQWQHHFAHFDSMLEQARNYMIDRRRVDNKELDDAIESTHVNALQKKILTRKPRGTSLNGLDP